MLVGLVLLASSTVLLCLGKSLPLLLVGRVLQGASAALTWTVGLALIIDSVDREHVGQSTGWIGSALSLGVLTGPLMGGVVYDKGGYYQVFAMCFGLIALDIVLRLLLIEVKNAQRWLDPNATDTEGGGQLAMSDLGNPSPQAQVEGPGGEHRGRPRGLLSLLRKPRLMAALWGTLAQAIIHTGLESTLPLVTADLFGWNSLGGGLIFLPLVVPTFLSPLIGKIGDRYGSKWLATTGFLFVTPFLVCLRFVSEDSMSHKVMLCGLLAGVGLGDSLLVGPLIAETTWAIEEDVPDGSTTPYALAYGLYNMAFSGGALIGPVLAGMIRDKHGWPAVGWVMALFTGVTAITQFLWTGRPLNWKCLDKLK